MNDEKLKVSVIRQELVELTGDYRQAIILNQFIYWSVRVRDYDLFLKEEQEREINNSLEFRNGWIYKTAEEMSEETMLGLSPSSIRRHIKALVEKGWLQERKNPNPNYKWDRTLQYRIDTLKLKKDLYNIGYVVNLGREYRVSILENGVHKTENGDKQNRKTIPEITSKDYVSESTKSYLHNPEDCDGYCYLSEIDNEFVQSYLAIMRPYRPSHKRVKKENINYILNAIELIRGSGFELPDWEQAVHEYFTQLPISNDGDIIAFLSASMRYFNVDVNFELGR